MAAGGPDVQDGLDIALYSEFFGYPYKSLQVGVYIIFILRSGIVYQDFGAWKLRKIVYVPYVACMMDICVIGNRRLLAVDSDDLVSLRQKMFRNGLSYALRSTGNQYSHVFSFQPYKFSN